MQDNNVQLDIEQCMVEPEPEPELEPEPERVVRFVEQDPAVEQDPVVEQDSNHSVEADSIGRADTLQPPRTAGPPLRTLHSHHTRLQHRRSEAERTL
jgi:hypothetical protein